MQCLCRLLDGIQMTLRCRDLTEAIPLFEGRLHMPTIKDAFTVRVARIDGVLPPADSQGFTHATFKPGDTLNISGTSAEVAAVPGTPHSRCLLQWHLISWYNMICTMSIPGTVHSALDSKHLCIQVPNLLLGVLLWCIIFSGALTSLYFKASFRCNLASFQTHS